MCKCIAQQFCLYFFRFFSSPWMGYPLQYSWASLVAQLAKNLPAVRETLVRFLGWEDPLEKGTSTHSSILAWRIPWTVAYQAPLFMEFFRQDTGMCSHSILQGIFLTQGSNWGLLHCRQILYHLIHQGRTIKAY